MTKTANKGEWSEIYVLFKLLGDKRVYAGDGQLNKIPEIFYPILKILREEKEGHYEYCLDQDIVIVTEDGTEILRKNCKEFLDVALQLLEVMKKAKGTFSVPIAEDFMNEIHCHSIKAGSQEKADIRIMIHDFRTGMSPTLGFSIKSQVGSDSTLLNSGKTTNFTYEVSGGVFSDESIEEINHINTRTKLLDRYHSIKQFGGELVFSKVDDRTFSNNLMMIDTCMPQILAAILLANLETLSSDISRLTKEVTKENPLNFDLEENDSFYEHKIKNFLVAVALGMVPHTPWKGKYEANGGYLVVKDDGDVLCYHIYDRNLFEDYLFYNTKLEKASSSRYEYASLYKEDNKLKYKLNLQIRFK